MNGKESFFFAWHLVLQFVNITLNDVGGKIIYSVLAWYPVLWMARVFFIPYCNGFKMSGFMVWAKLGVPLQTFYL